MRAEPEIEVTDLLHQITAIFGSSQRLIVLYIEALICNSLTITLTMVNKFIAKLVKEAKKEKKIMNKKRCGVYK